MSSSVARDDDQRIRELLSGLALGELEQAEEHQAVQALEQSRWQRELLELEIAASAIGLTGHSRVGSERLPNHLRNQIQIAAVDFFRSLAVHESAEDAINDQAPSTGVRTSSVALDKPVGTSSTPDVAAVLARPTFNKSLYRELIAWLACAAALVLAVGVWTSGPGTAPPHRLAPELAMMQLLERDPAALQIAWQAGTMELPGKVDGQVVWSQELQEGYMIFRGLPVNDPTKEQYQLWIIDPDRDDVPIDGGVFDVTSTGEAIVKIDAKLAVLNPQAFAITIEQPGGVVVSDQSRLPLLAPVK